jgi:hypothetical protein
LQYRLQYESYSYNIWNNYFIISWNYISLLFFHCVFYTCLLAVRQASARQAALSYLVSDIALPARWRKSWKETCRVRTIHLNFGPTETLVIP